MAFLTLLVQASSQKKELKIALAMTGLAIGKACIFTTLNLRENTGAVRSLRGIIFQQSARLRFYEKQLRRPGKAQYD